jgi:hypothetical protein
MALTIQYNHLDGITQFYAGMNFFIMVWTSPVTQFLDDGQFQLPHYAVQPKTFPKISHGSQLLLHPAKDAQFNYRHKRLFQDKRFRASFPVYLSLLSTEQLFSVSGPLIYRPRAFTDHLRCKPMVVTGIEVLFTFDRVTDAS